VTRPTDEIRARPSAAAPALPRIAWIEEAWIEEAGIEEARVDGASTRGFSRLRRGACRRATRSQPPTDAELDCLARLLALPHPQSLMSQADGFMATRGSGSSRSALLGHLPRGSAIAFLACTAAALGLSPYFLQNLPHDFASDGSLRARESFAGMSGSPPRGDREMRKSVVSGVVAGAIASGVIGGVAAPVHAQDAVQWRVEDGGNGHWYQWTSWGQFASTSEAVQFAEARGAYLATLTTANEEGFVQANAIAGSCSFTAGSEALIGLLQDKGAGEPSGGWRWITNEPLIYSNWRASEPSNSGSVEHIGFLNRSGGWNDGGTVLGCANASIIEWSADCNSDGIVDFGQIRVGELDDANANNIPDCCEQGVACLCPSDIDGNGTVDAIDLAIVIGYWGTNGGKEYPQADIDRSGDIDAADLAALLGAWGPCE
jgi:hypothetical protein